MAIKIIIESSENDFQRDDLVCEQQLITFGRSKSCTVELDHPQVSKRHFIIRFTEGRYILIDEGSTAGTLVDGQMLEPLKTLVLLEQHQVVVPGYHISIFNDGHAPRLERTTVVARKLIGQILEDAPNSEKLPRLEDVAGTQVFLFTDDRVSFVLGSSAHLDFVVTTDPLIAKEHVSFIRDMVGVKIIPIMDVITKVCDVEVHEPYVMAHGDIVDVGATRFIFKTHADQLLLSPSSPLSALTESSFDPLPSKPLTAPGKSPKYSLLDGLFFGLFISVTVGASLLFIKLI